MGFFSMLSECLAYEVNRNAFGLMWRKDYPVLIRAWTVALAVGGILAAIGMASGQTWLLPFAVTVQLLLSIASLKINTNSAI